MSHQVKPVTFVTVFWNRGQEIDGGFLSLTRVKNRTVYKPLNFLLVQKKLSLVLGKKWTFLLYTVSFSRSLRIVSTGQKRPIIKITKMTNYLTWVNVIIEIIFSLAFMQITIAYGFSPWRGRIYEILESKDLWNDLLNDLVIPTLPISPPKRLVFSRFFEVFRGFLRILKFLKCLVGFKDR